MTPFLIVPFSGLIMCTSIMDGTVDANANVFHCEPDLWESSARIVFSLNEATKDMIYNGYDGRVYEIDIAHQLLIEREVPRVEIGGKCVIGCKEKPQ